MFSTLQDRLPKELALAGVTGPGKTGIDAANRFIAQIYLPAHNARFAKPAAVAESAFVAVDPAQLAEILCVEVERVVARDNTVQFGKLRLQLPQSPHRHHFVKANVRVRQYPDGCLAVFHGPRRIARYDARGREIGEPIPTMLQPCSTPSRRGLVTAQYPAGTPAQWPALTAPRHGAAA